VAAFFSSCLMWVMSVRSVRSCNRPDPQ
jgi:hypothetical protein